ncbi:MAG: hypothetical protein IPJ23_01920 [Ignavibacteriales bacterium]|nr:hypothetical protein [Ignavibacteriales bacterium]
MKKLIFAVIVILFALSASADANTNYANRVGGYFYTSLSPYGTWMEIGFGTPVWRPINMRRNWSPYTQGQWIYTDYGWYWDSYEDFGEIVYHYGRWYYDDFYGWIWIPDYEWAPAWVDWRYDDDYIGWAPLSPYALFTINIGIHYTYDYYVPYSHWNYVKYNNFCDHNVYNYYLAPKYKYAVYNKTKMRTNYSYYEGRVRNDGVDFDRIRERSGRNIEKRNIVTYSNPMQRTKVRDNEKNNREIRTYIASREDISRDGLQDVKIERKERKSTLEISKLELGRDRTLDKTNDTRKVETREINKTSREENNDNTRVRTENTRKETNNDVTRNKVEEERKVQERKKVEQRNSEIEKRNIEQNKRNEEIKRNEQIKRTEEIKRNEQIKNNEQIERQKKTKEETQKRNEVTIQKREQNNEQKVQQRQETQKVEQRNQNNNVNRNTEVKRNNTNTETKKDTRTSDKNSSGRTR